MIGVVKLSMKLKVNEYRKNRTFIFIGFYTKYGLKCYHYLLHYTGCVEIKSTVAIATIIIFKN